MLKASELSGLLLLLELESRLFIMPFSGQLLVRLKVPFFVHLPQVVVQGRDLSEKVLFLVSGLFPNRNPGLKCGCSSQYDPGQP